MQGTAGLALPEPAIARLKQAVAIYVEIEAGAIQPDIWKLAEW